MITADLTAALLDPDPFMHGKPPAEKAEPSGKDDERVFPADWLPLDSLGTVDAVLTFKIA